MPRSANQKKKLLLLVKIFSEYSDSENLLTMNDLITHLSRCGISAERKSIYQDIEALRELGYDIITVKGKNCGYYLGSRVFELPEIKLLIDAVCASKFITQKKSRELVKKLSEFASVSQRKNLKREVFVSDRVKNSNEKIYYAVDIIHEAISENRNITFNYYMWNEKKEKVYRHGGKRYNVSPYLLVWDDENYYLAAYDCDASEIRHYRVDKMDCVKISDEKRSGKEAFDGYDVSQYTRSRFGMFSGEPENVTLLCENSFANIIIDKFGKDPVFISEGDRFRVTVKVAVSPVFLGWIFGFGGKIKIVAPDSAVREFEKLKNQ